MKKWINWIALVLIFSIACGFLATWQFSRRESKLAAISLVKQNYESPALDFDELARGNELPLPQQSWRLVNVSGHYLPNQFLLVRNRPNNGQPGFEQLVPFVSDSGHLIYVSRGWISSGSKQDYPETVNLPNSSETTISARLMPQEPILNRTAPAGQIATINISLAEAKSGMQSSFQNGYFRLVSETPEIGIPLKAMPAPATGEGNNLSYALQWILFALMAATALVWRIRRDTLTAKGIVSHSKQKHSELDAEYEDQATRER